MLNIYGPNDDNIKHFKTLEEYVLKNNDKNIIGLTLIQTGDKL